MICYFRYSTNLTDGTVVAEESRGTKRNPSSADLWCRAGYRGHSGWAFGAHFACVLQGAGREWLDNTKLSVLRSQGRITKGEKCQFCEGRSPYPLRLNGATPLSEDKRERFARRCFRIKYKIATNLSYEIQYQKQIIMVLNLPE